MTAPARARDLHAAPFGRLPVALPGMEDIARHWDPRWSSSVATIRPGEFYVTAADEGVMTVLGSCVSACIRDPRTGVGGMNHFMLPMSADDDAQPLSTAARYGNYAMEVLVNTIMRHGGARERLEVKLFGGGRMLSGDTAIGARNIGFVEEYVHTELLHVLSRDLGDVYPRKVLYFPATGRALVKRLRSLREDVMQTEVDYSQRLREEPASGSIELF